MITSIGSQSLFPNPFTTAHRAAPCRQEATAAQAETKREEVEKHVKPLQELTQAMNRLDYMLDLPVFRAIE